MTRTAGLPLFIKHRCNRIADLDAAFGSDPALNMGVEIDLRSNVRQPGAIHLAHDPWSEGESFEAWLKEFARLGIRGPILLNTKEDGLEKRAMELLETHSLHNYLFLDTALPTLVRLTREGLGSRMMIRLSRHEPLELALALPKGIEWVWADCFGLEPLPEETLLRAKDRFKICLVSPELQGGDDEAFERFKGLGRISDAICTKRPERWTELLG